MPSFPTLLPTASSPRGATRCVRILSLLIGVLTLFPFGSELDGQSSAAWVDTVIVTGEVTDAGVLSARVEQRVRGSGHPAALAFLRSPGNETARMYIRALASDLGLSGPMREIELQLPDETGDPLEVGFRTRVAGFVDPAADTSVASIPFPAFALPADPGAGAGGGSSTSATRRSRSFFARVRIVFPPSMDCCVPPTPVEVSDDQFRFRSAGHVAGNMLVATRSLRIDPAALDRREQESYRTMRRATAAPVRFSVGRDRSSPAFHDPGDSDELVKAGLAARNEGRHDRALSLFRRAVRLRPDHPRAWSRLGTTSLRLNRLAEAETAFRRQIEINPNVPHVYASLAVSLDRQGKRREAEEVYRRQLELAPNDSYGVVGLASLLVYDGRREEALSLLSRAGGPDEIEVGRPDLQVTLGWTLMHADHPETAIPVLREALESDSTIAGARAYLGRALRMTGDTREALPHLRKAVEIAPGRAEYRVDLARALWEIGNEEEALSMLREGRSRSPDHWALCMALGHTLTRLGRGEEAPKCSRD